MVPPLKRLIELAVEGGGQLSIVLVGQPRLEGRYQPIARLQVSQIAARFCRGHDELRNYLRPVPAATSMFPSTGRRTLFLRRTATVLDILAAVGRNAGAQNDIHAFAYQVDQPVALADMKFEVGIALEERWQIRQQQSSSHAAMNIDPEQSRWSLIEETALRFVDFGKDAHTALVEGITVECRRHVAGGPLQQSHFQPC